MHITACTAQYGIYIPNTQRCNRALGFSIRKRVHKWRMLTHLHQKHLHHTYINHTKSIFIMHIVKTRYLIVFVCMQHETEERDNCKAAATGSCQIGYTAAWLSVTCLLSWICYRRSRIILLKLLHLFVKRAREKTFLVILNSSLVMRQNLSKTVCMSKSS